MAEFDGGEQTKTILMEKMDNKLKELLKKERCDSIKLIEYLHMQGVTTLEDLYKQKLSDMERFLSPTQQNTLKEVFQDHQMEISTHNCLKESKSFQDLMEVDEEGNDAIFNYEIVRDSEGIIGKALIIVNKKFTHHKIRDGADEDLKNLETMFKSWNVKIESHFDLDGGGMKQCLEDFAKQTENVSIVFVAISTHGVENNTVLSTDGEHILIDDYIHIFQRNKMLVGKPKIFFIQACRGTLVDERIPTHESDNSKQCIAPKEIEFIPIQTFASNTSDILIAYATSDKYLAWRDSKKGSWFIIELNKSFEKYPCRHLIEILTITANVIIRDYKSNKDDKVATQCCNFHSSLTKFVYLWTS